MPLYEREPENDPAQLDLFDWMIPVAEPIPEAVAPTGATIIPFPQRRNIGKARHVARLALAREGKAQDSYWRQVCSRMTQCLEAAGLSVEAINFELLEFGGAVAREMDRLTNSSAPEGGRSDESGALARNSPRGFSDPD